MQRRSFLSAASLTAAGLSAPLAAHADTPRRDASLPDPLRHPQDAWLDTLPTAHRLFIDSTTIAEVSNAVSFAFNFLVSSRTGYNLKDGDQGVIVCLRHHSAEMALPNDLWRRYPSLTAMSYRHPVSDAPITGVNIFRAGAESPPSLDESHTLEGLARRGVHFAICGLAIRRLATIFAGSGANYDRIEGVLDELVKALPPNSHLMASGVLAAQRAGEYGYTILKG